MLEFTRIKPLKEPQEFFMILLYTGSPDSSVLKRMVQYWRHYVKPKK